MTAPDKATQIKAALTAIIAFGTALWGNVGWMIMILIVCIALDYFTGTLAAMHLGEWSSSVARQGLWHKLGEIFALLVAILCDIAIKVILDGAAAEIISGITLPKAPLTMLVSIWYTFTELGSIIENCDKLGAPVPKFLTRIIASLKHKADPEEPEAKQDNTDNK